MTFFTKTLVQNGNSERCHSADVVQTLFTVVLMLDDDDSKGVLPWLHSMVTFAISFNFTHLDALGCHLI